MKLLTIAIPSYNSQDYMAKCIESLLPGGSEVEILIIDDGSKDRTAEIADEYAAKYPDIVKAIHQENAGHGGAVNTGIKNASGLYFKVVDSDDKVDYDSYMKILKALRKSSRTSSPTDLFISNYIYDKQGVENKTVMQYRKYLPVGKTFGWNDMKTMPMGKYILMHSVIYRTGLLRLSGLKLPKHTFYVDNIYVFQPLPFVKTIEYIDVDFYKYFIGRDDQSVNEKVMISRLDQQYRVTYLMIDYFKNIRKSIDSPKLKKYMYSYLTIIVTISSILSIKSGTEEHLQMKRELWDYLKKTDYEMYKKLRSSFLGIGTNLPGKAGRKIAIWGYGISQKMYGFN